MTLHLVTGHAGKIHVTAAEQGDFNARVFGSGAYIINGCEAEILDENTVHVGEGTMLIQGRHVNVNSGGDDVTITNGTVGLRRRDVICLQYKMDTGNGVETVEFVVVKGEPAEGWETPVIEPQSILDGDNPCLIPLWSVDIDTDRTVGNLQLWADDISGHSDVLEYIGKAREDLEDLAERLDFPVAVELGGTGATNADEARSNLNIPLPTDYEGTDSSYPSMNLLKTITEEKKLNKFKTADIEAPDIKYKCGDANRSEANKYGFVIQQFSASSKPETTTQSFVIGNIEKLKAAAEIDFPEYDYYDGAAKYKLSSVDVKIGEVTLSNFTGYNASASYPFSNLSVSNVVIRTVGESIWADVTFTYSYNSGWGASAGYLNFDVSATVSATAAYELVFGEMQAKPIYEDVSDKFGYTSSQLAFVKATKLGNIVFVNIGTVSNQTGNFNVQINDESVVPVDWGQGLRARLALGEGMSVSSIIYAQDNGNTGSTTGKGFRVYNGSAGTLSFFYFVN